MTDRELLKLAAKAYGFGASDSGDVTWTESEYPKGSGKNGALWNYVGWCDTAQLWNPLTDDGDAFRLAVKLHFVVDVGVMSTAISGLLDNQQEFINELHGDDPSTATRRAVVRAAAEIGKQQK